MTGNLSSATLVSCRATASTSAVPSHSTTRSSRDRRELTFHVASRTPSTLGHGASVATREQTDRPRHRPDRRDRVLLRPGARRLRPRPGARLARRRPPRRRRRRARRPVRRRGRGAPRRPVRPRPARPGRGPAARRGPAGRPARQQRGLRPRAPRSSAATLDDELRQLDVMGTAVLVLCHAAVPGHGRARPRGRGQRRARWPASARWARTRRSRRGARRSPRACRPRSTGPG